MCIIVGRFSSSLLQMLTMVSTEMINEPIVHVKFGGKWYKRNYYSFTVRELIYSMQSNYLPRNFRFVYGNKIEHIICIRNQVLSFFFSSIICLLIPLFGPQMKILFSNGTRSLDKHDLSIYMVSLIRIKTGNIYGKHILTNHDKYQLHTQIF